MNNNEKSSEIDAEVSDRFDKLTNLIETMLEIQKSDKKNPGLQKKMPAEIADVVLMEAAKASISKASDFVRKEIDNKLRSINSMISDYETAFSKEKNIVDTLIRNENSGAYTSAYHPATAQPSASPKVYASETQKKTETANRHPASDANNTSAATKIDFQKINSLISDMKQKIQNSTDDEKKVISGYVSQMETIFREMLGTDKNNPDKT